MTDLDFKKQYVVQAITLAANNLRLSSEKIEVVTLLREHLLESEDMFLEIQSMKTITEFSKFAVRLGELYEYISGAAIDFLKISEKFKEQSHNLVRDLSALLDTVTPADFKKIVEKRNDETEVEYSLKKHDTNELVDWSKESKQSSEFVELPEEKQSEEKEKFILGDLKTNVEFDFDNYVFSVLRPIKKFDAFLERLAGGNYKSEELENYYDTFRQNAVLSRKAGLEIITRMHRNLYEALDLIHEGRLDASKENLDLLRACLVVIVAIVREKDVDISDFLAKAEILTQRLNELLEE